MIDLHRAGEGKIMQSRGGFVFKCKQKTPLYTAQYNDASYMNCLLEEIRRMVVSSHLLRPSGSVSVSLGRLNSTIVKFQ